MKKTDSRFPGSPVSEVTFAFLDIETTGLSASKGGKICEVAVSRRRGDSDLGHFQTLVHPGCVIPEEVIRIHGITNEMVAGSPRFPGIAPRLLSLISDSVVVCHNAGFDIGFLEHEFSVTGLRFPPVHVIDTLKIARKYGRFASNRLGFIASELGISTEGWHRALNDVKMMEKVFAHFLGKFSENGTDTLEGILSLGCNHKPSGKARD